MNMNDHTQKGNLTPSAYPGSAEAVLLFLDPCYADNESIVREVLELAGEAGLTEAVSNKGESLKVFNELRAIVEEVYARRNAADDAER